MALNEFLVMQQTNLLGTSFLFMITHTKPSVIKTTCNKFLIIYWAKVLVSSSNFIMNLANSIISKFVCNFWITEICQISDVSSSLKYKFKNFLQMDCHFRLHCHYSYVVLQYSFILWMIVSLKRKSDLLTSTISLAKSIKLV